MDPTQESGLVVAAGTVRGTQSLVHTMRRCWKHPAWTLQEVLWRWLVGIPELLVVGWYVRRILAAHTRGTFDLTQLGLDSKLLGDPVGTAAADPLGAAAKWMGAVSALLPDMLHVAVWLAPLMLMAWIGASAIGRSVVFRRVDPKLTVQPATFFLLQLSRMLALMGCFLLWFIGLHRVVATAITAPISAGGEPNLVLYFALNIILTLGLFTLWAVVSWVFSIAPLLAMVRNQSAPASLVAAFHVGALRSKLVEMNLVLGIVKIALLILAVVFSATPLPFESVTTQEFLVWWWMAVSVLYLVACDFFHVVRMVGYLELWRAYSADDSIS